MAEAQLDIHLPGQAPRQQRLAGSCYRLGRDARAEIVIDHAAVSRRHALLEQRGDQWLLRDLDSTNGIWWHGTRVKELLLSDGDRVRFGPSHLPDLPEIRFASRPASRLRVAVQVSVLALVGIFGGGLLLLLLSLIQMHQYPSVLIDALLASEDSRFWWHPGVDPIGTGRALLANLVGGRVLEGGSTLTQQLARSLYPEQVGQGETLGRKWRELLVALQLEARFSKRDLLLSYLNRVFLGSGWGFEDASRHLFGKPAARLELAEAALLVGLLPSPNGYDPCFDPQAALAARNQVLAKMADTGRINADLARSARRQPIQLASQACRSRARRAAPFYTDQVRRDLENLVGVDVAAEGNFLIDTHLDPSLQELIERLLRQHLDASRSLGVSQGAVVVLDSRNGGILAIAGGRDYRLSQFNRATMALRQPGSTFKLVPYLLALERGSKPSDTVDCGPLEWRGQRFSSGCRGRLSLRQALAISSNTAALRMARQVGLESVVQKARDLGISSPLNPVPGLALGQSEVTLLELTGAYGAIADDGIWHAPSTIRRLTDAEACPRSAQSNCHTGQAPTGSSAPSSLRSTGAAGRRVTSPASARAMRSLLQAVVSSGTGTAAYVGGGAGGKTGTTNDGRDLWFIGFVPQRHWVMGVWLGNDNNAPTHASSALAASLWGDIVRSSSPAP
ncbi:MAG: transglycosylase domain-containing protein [Cyanobacteria bacterium]|nr:transglycosylase domain-containing protein [Cyanobacteriota bacterium]